MSCGTQFALPRTSRPSTVDMSFALASEALRRTQGVELFDVQIYAALKLADGHVAEMQTGEGKTLSAVPVAVARGLTGQGVHVATPNTYLSQRDYEQLKPAYELLGLTAGLLPEPTSEIATRAAYECDITYGTGYQFGFDYLRDQLVLRRNLASKSLGHSIIDRLRTRQPYTTSVAQRSRAFAIVDEVDHVLIDDAGSPLILSDTGNSAATDADAHIMARALAIQMAPDRHYRWLPAVGRIELTPQGQERIFAPDVEIPVKQLRRAWTEYIEQALRAELLFRCDVHYIVQAGQVQIVDASTGRIFSDRTWQDGLHQAIEAKEQLEVTAEKHVLAQISRQRFYRLYEQLAGMTGTAQGCEREFKHVYQLSVTPIPLRVSSRRKTWPLRCFATSDAKWQAIARDIQAIHQTGRPVLVGTRSIADSEHLASVLTRNGLPFALLNGRQDEEEAELVSLAGRVSAITLATDLAGRGTDIRLQDHVRHLGGLHVIVAEPHESTRVDRQLTGRCARQGDPGSVQTYVCAQDALIQLHGPWLTKTLTAAADRNGEVRVDLTRRLRRLQRIAERMQFAARSQLLRRDLQRDSLLAKLGYGS